MAIIILSGGLGPKAALLLQPGGEIDTLEGEPGHFADFNGAINVTGPQAVAPRGAQVQFAGDGRRHLVAKRLPQRLDEQG